VWERGANLLWTTTGGGGNGRAGRQKGKTMGRERKTRVGRICAGVAGKAISYEKNRPGEPGREEIKLGEEEGPADPTRSKAGGR